MCVDHTILPLYLLFVRSAFPVSCFSRNASLLGVPNNENVDATAAQNESATQLCKTKMRRCSCANENATLQLCKTKMLPSCANENGGLWCPFRGRSVRPARSGRGVCFGNCKIMGEVPEIRVRGIDNHLGKEPRVTILHKTIEEGDPVIEGNVYSTMTLVRHLVG